MDNYRKYLEKWIKDEVNKTGLKGVVFGLSGGIDSAVVAGLIRHEFKDNHIALIMSCESDDRDEIDAMKVINDFDLNYRSINLSNIWKDYIKLMGTKNEIGNANTKSRLRMTTLYNIAQENNYLVLGTSNKDEIFLGYFTKYGDGASDLLPLSSLNKMEIFELAKNLKVDSSIINKPPSAGLIKNQTDEDDMKIKYEDISKYFDNKKNLSKDKIIKIENIRDKNKHKSVLMDRPKSLMEFKNEK